MRAALQGCSTSALLGALGCSHGVFVFSEGELSPLLFPWSVGKHRDSFYPQEALLVQLVVFLCLKCHFGVLEIKMELLHRGEIPGFSLAVKSVFCIKM